MKATLVTFFVITTLAAFASAQEFKTMDLDSADVKFEEVTNGEGKFRKMETSDIAIEKIDIQPTSTYISPEVKRRQ